MDSNLKYWGGALDIAAFLFSLCTQAADPQLRKATPPQDMKDCDAISVADFIRMKGEGFVPDRDIILAVTADEEHGSSNGVDWLLKNHREFIDAEFVLYPDAGGVRYAQ